MNIKSIGFVGGGRAAKIILAGWKQTGTLPEKIVVSDPDPAALDALARFVPNIETTGDNTVAAEQEVCFLAVHPPLAKEVVPALASCLKGQQMLVSLLPKLSIEKLSGMLGGFDRIARLIPNAASFIGKGYNPVAFAEHLSAEDWQKLGELLDPLGETPVVKEPTLEAYAIVTAMGPTYLWPQLYQLKGLAESFGLSSDAAMEGIGQMVRGSVELMARAELSPEVVQDLVPVKPLAEEVDALCQTMENKLSGLMEKLRP